MGIDACFYRHVNGEHLRINIPYEENDSLKVGWWAPGYFRNPNHIEVYFTKLGLNVDVHKIWGDFARDVHFQPDLGWQAVYDDLFIHATRADFLLKESPNLLTKDETKSFKWELNCMLATAKYLAEQPNQKEIYGSWG